MINIIGSVLIENVQKEKDARRNEPLHWLYKTESKNKISYEVNKRIIYRKVDDMKLSFNKNELNQSFIE